MDSTDKKTLQKQLEFYSNLLKKHEISKKEHKLGLTSIQQQSQRSSWKRPPLSAYKMVKNSNQPSICSDQKYLFSKTHNSSLVTQNKRTVLFNKNHFNAKCKFSSYKSPKNTTFPSNKIASQRSLNLDPPATCEKSVLCPEVSNKAPSNSSEKTSYSQNLLKEIESLTKMLKKSSESKSKFINTTAKSKNVVQNKLVSCKINQKSSTYSAFSKCNILKNESGFSKSNLPKIKMPSNHIRGNISSSVVLSGGQSSCYSKFNSSNKRKHLSNFNLSKSVNLDKYHYKKVDMKQTLNSKANRTVLKTIESEDKLMNIEKTITRTRVREAISEDFKSVTGNLYSNTTLLKSKPLTQDNDKLMKLDMIKEPANSGPEISRKLPNFYCKSPSIHKSSIVPKVNSTGSRYKRINTIHSVISNKNVELKNTTTLQTSLSKRMKKKVNTKFKVINKTASPYVRTVLSSSRHKENSVSTDESDPLFKYLNDSSIDKLEKDLLAFSTALTSTPTSVINDSKIYQPSSSKMNTKFNVKVHSLKKFKSGISRYKVINSGVLPNQGLKKRPIYTHRKTTKAVKSRYRVINKHLQPVGITPAKQGKSILVKRLFKSKNTIINKNASPINHSAKMIKSKYLSLNKRRSYEKHGLFSKVPLSQRKFKGHFISSKLHSKQNKYQKLAYYPQKVTRYSRYRCHSQNKSISGSKYKRKLNNRYGHSPVVYIQGVKYSRNSSGKTLRKFPVKGQISRNHQRIINRKSFSRPSENKMKTVSPFSSLANRVLHRSIARVLTASSKKSLRKVNTYCMFYNRFGRCNRGVKCTYIHDPSKIAVCTRFLRGTCKVDGCPFSHEISPGKMAICSFFLVGACEKDNCPYRHEKLSPNAQLCKAFVQGYCPSGKECKKAHILICPKYIQGECEKGSSCAFPHPPQKVKKNDLKEIDEETKKPDDVLLEKVARYFQQGADTTFCQNKSHDEKSAKLCVPRQKKRLEEQPSFIPLFDNPEL